MENLQKKSVTQLTRKFHIGATLWDGLINPFKKNKLTMSILVVFLYSRIMYYIAFESVLWLKNFNR